MGNRLPNRNEVPVELTWNLSDLYENEAAWKADCDLALAAAEHLSARAGKAAESASALLASMDLYETAQWKNLSIYNYATMFQDQDTVSSKGQELIQKAQSITVKVDEKMAFFIPELLLLSPEKLESYFEEEPGLEKYRVILKEMLRGREHTLSREMEELLASAGELTSVPYNGFSALVDADLTFPSVKDGNGNDYFLTNGRFVPAQMSTDRILRENTFKALYERYKEFSNTWAALLDGQMKALLFNAKARKYESSFVAAAEGDSNVSRKVFENLIASVHDNIGLLHRYIGLRKKMLGVDELHMYDIYAPMVSDFEMKVSYEEAKKMTLEALKPLGEEYCSTVREGYENRWIDVVESKGKRSGAYSNGVYGTHPYMLLNWANTLDDAFVLIHEMGHSMQTWYSDHEQNFFNSQYSMFVAEVASTTNEILLLEYLLGKAEDPKEKQYLLNHYLESFKGTLFRQAMFGEYEYKIHQMEADGLPITAEGLSDLYLKTNQFYYGPDMISDPLIGCEWMRIPHLYYNFYVYQYATSYAASVAIAHRILEEGQPMVQKYLTFLKSGCITDPVSVLKIAGVDLSTREPIDEAMKVFESVLDRMQ